MTDDLSFYEIVGTSVKSDNADLSAALGLCASNEVELVLDGGAVEFKAACDNLMVKVVEDGVYALTCETCGSWYKVSLAPGAVKDAVDRMTADAAASTDVFGGGHG